MLSSDRVSHDVCQMVVETSWAQQVVFVRLDFQNLLFLVSLFTNHPFQLSRPSDVDVSLSIIRPQTDIHDWLSVYNRIWHFSSEISSVAASRATIRARCSMKVEDVCSFIWTSIITTESPATTTAPNSCFLFPSCSSKFYTDASVKNATNPSRNWLSLCSLSSCHSICCMSFLFHWEYFGFRFGTFSHSMPLTEVLILTNMSPVFSVRHSLLNSCSTLTTTLC